MITQQLWGTLLIFFAVPLLGGLPLIDWVSYIILKKKLSNIGTKNISVSAAFYHGGTLLGISAVISEASKGIIAVLIGRYFFPDDPKWEIFALTTLVIGRYWFTQGAGVTNLAWGMIIHNPLVTLLTLLVGGTSFIIWREKRTSRYVVLSVFGVLSILFRANDPQYILAAFSLIAVLWLILEKIPDDLELPSTAAQDEAKKVFKFFQAKASLHSLNDPLIAAKVGQKAANLSYLKRLGYNVPEGWVILVGEDLKEVVQYLAPTPENPLVVRSSAVGEDSETASAAGQYLSTLNITNRLDLLKAISATIDSYNVPSAVQYRQTQGQSEQNMAVIIQKQVIGVYSGVAFSRDPVNPLNPAVVIEALPGSAVSVVSGEKTPEQYQVNLTEPPTIKSSAIATLPTSLVEEVAILTRELESLWHGLPQDIEWSYASGQLWLLQARRITTLAPIWTRRIAAEVIPGVIRPLTWSINRPLTCGVWGEIFTIVLGEKASDLDFNQTATLHYQQAYFNATLLGEIFQRMGLPPESLDFLTRGTKFSKPPLKSTLKTLPGLLRLLLREVTLEGDFKKDLPHFKQQLTHLKALKLDSLTPQELVKEIDNILVTLKRVTYYSILAPLSLALRTALFKVNLADLDNSKTPEVQAMRSLWTVKQQPDQDYHFNLWLQEYGYLSQAATDISVSRWQEEPATLKSILNSLIEPPQPTKKPRFTPGQQRLNLKGEVTGIYSQFLAYLRWCFLALELIYLKTERLSEVGDIFFLEYPEIISLEESDFNPQALIAVRRKQWEENQAITSVPYVVYGQPRPYIEQNWQQSEQDIQGIPASGGEVEGTIQICQTLLEAINLPNDTILVVPYTDSGWVPLLAQAKGLISQVGGVLSHGAIIAREYGIPAVMDVHDATNRLQNGQRVRLNGYTGWIKILDV